MLLLFLSWIRYFFYFIFFFLYFFSWINLLFLFILNSRNLFRYRLGLLNCLACLIFPISRSLVIKDYSKLFPNPAPLPLGELVGPWRKKPVFVANFAIRELIRKRPYLAPNFEISRRPSLRGGSRRSTLHPGSPERPEVPFLLSPFDDVFVPQISLYHLKKILWNWKIRRNMCTHIPC